MDGNTPYYAVHALPQYGSPSGPSAALLSLPPSSPSPHSPLTQLSLSTALPTQAATTHTTPGFADWKASHVHSLLQQQLLAKNGFGVSVGQEEQGRLQEESEPTHFVPAVKQKLPKDTLSHLGFHSFNGLELKRDINLGGTGSGFRQPPWTPRFEMSTDSFRTDTTASTSTTTSSEIRRPIISRDQGSGSIQSYVWESDCVKDSNTFRLWSGGSSIEREIDGDEDVGVDEEEEEEVEEPMNVRKPSKSRAWTNEEDQRVRDLVAEYGLRKWSLVAMHLNDKTQKQVYARWRDYLQPGISNLPWTKKEQKRLEDLHKVLGNQWAVLTKMLPGRSPNAIKNRFHATRRKLERSQKKNGGVIIERCNV